jgi:hypothetical protein
MTITSEELAKLRMAATPGEWHIGGPDHLYQSADVIHVVVDDFDGVRSQDIGEFGSVADSRLAVAAVNALRNKTLIHVDEVEAFEMWCIQDRGNEAQDWKLDLSTLSDTEGGAWSAISTGQDIDRCNATGVLIRAIEVRVTVTASTGEDG